MLQICKIKCVTSPFKNKEQLKQKIVTNITCLIILSHPIYLGRICFACIYMIDYSTLISLNCPDKNYWLPLDLLYLLCLL